MDETSHRTKDTGIFKTRVRFWVLLSYGFRRRVTRNFVEVIAHSSAGISG